MRRQTLCCLAFFVTTRAYVSHVRPRSELSTHTEDACKVAVEVLRPYGVDEENNAYVRGLHDCSTPDRSFCAWTVRKGVPEGVYAAWKPHNAGCFVGETHCDKIRASAPLGEEVGRNIFAVKKQCNEEAHCVFNDGNQFAAHDCHPELLEPSKKYVHVCGKCVFLKPLVWVFNQSGTLSYIPVAGAPSSGNAMDCSGDRRCLDLLSAVNWDARAVQLEAMYNRHTETEELYRKAASTRTRLLGAAHPDTQHSYRSLVRFYEAAGMYTKSEATAAQLTRQSAHPSTA